MPSPPETFFAMLEELGIELDAGDLDIFQTYLDRLLETNTKFNLTAIRDPAEAWLRHIADSLTLMPMLSALAPGDLVADVGSGGGAPGLPLAIAMPRLRFTLIESTGKKADFLRDVGAEVAPGRIEVLSERAETVGQDRTRRAAYAAAMARALGPLRVALELVMPLVSVGGIGLFIKGSKVSEEIAEASTALRALRCEVLEVAPTPTGRIVVVEKQAPTPRGYPRRPGEPKRAPL